jgi:ribulose-5-phosphate 4-epimerase/fuculose-1-phosphate aldolase
MQNLAPPPTFATAEEERRHRKIHLAGAFRLFARFGFDEGVAGHITVRDPERADWFWVNPFGVHFSQIRASDLILVNDRGSDRGRPPRQHRGLRHPLARPRRAAGCR